MKDKMTKTKSGFDKFKEIWKNPRYRSIIILGFYFLFFLFIIIALRTNNTTTNFKSDKESTDFEYSLSKIKSSNYHFLYEINLNNTKILYDGDKCQNKELFTKSNDLIKEQYYNYEGKYLKNINGVWSKTDNPYLFDDFIDVYSLEKLLKKATYDSKTEYSNNSKVYIYKLSTTSIVKVLEKTNIDIADNPNVINLTTDSDNEVVKINIDLTPYISYKNQNNQQLNINLDYSNFGKIEEIKDPE